MSVFGSIMSKIFSAAESVVHKAEAPTEVPPSAAAAPNAPSASASVPTSAAGSTPAQAPSAPVDVEAVLSGMASQKGGGGNWRTSIVDLLKLLDLDSSLSARKELATELNVRAGADGSAEENIALHKAVMQKLAENGGKVPETMKA
ncbi:MAG TPA: DUF3597 domain-containing protein [Rhodopila sp.]